MSVSRKISHSTPLVASFLCATTAFVQPCFAGGPDSDAVTVTSPSHASAPLRLPDWLMGFNEDTYAENSGRHGVQHALRSVVDPEMPGNCWVYGCPPIDWKIVDKLNPLLRNKFIQSFQRVRLIEFSDPNTMAFYARYVQDYIFASTTFNSSFEPLIWVPGVPHRFNWRQKMAEVQRDDPDYRVRHNIKSIAEYAHQLQLDERNRTQALETVSESNGSFYSVFEKSLPLETQYSLIQRLLDMKQRSVDLNQFIETLRIFDSPQFAEDREWLFNIVQNFSSKATRAGLNPLDLDTLKEMQALYTEIHKELKGNPLSAELGISPANTLFLGYEDYQHLPSPSKQANEILACLEEFEPTFFQNPYLRNVCGRKLTQLLSEDFFIFNKDNFARNILPTYQTLATGSNLIEKMRMLCPMIMIWEVSKLKTTDMPFFCDLADAIRSSLETGYERINIFHELAIRNFSQLPPTKQSIDAVAQILHSDSARPSAFTKHLAQYLLGTSARVASYPSPQRVGEIVDQLGENESLTTRTLLAMKLVNTPSDILHEKSIEAVMQLKTSIHPDFFYDSAYYIGSNFREEQITRDFVKSLEPIVRLDAEEFIENDNHCIFEALAQISDDKKRQKSLETLNILLEKAPILKLELELPSDLPRSPQDYAKLIVKIPDLWKLHENAKVIAEGLAQNSNYLFYESVIRKLRNPKYKQKSDIEKFFSDFGKVEYTEKSNFLRAKKRGS